METAQSTVPGAGVLHDCQTRDGQQFRIFVGRPGRCEIFIYDSAEPDRAVARIVLAEDEADQVAELLHSQPITDRIAELERRVDRLAGSARKVVDPRVSSIHTGASVGSCDAAGPAN